MRKTWCLLLLGMISINIWGQSVATNEMIKPPYLKVGDTVAIVAPSGIVKDYKRPYINKAIKLLESWGLVVEMGKHVYAHHGHFAGSDEQRAKDMQWAMDAPHIKAIWCARGGYGAVRILDKLDYKTFLKRPKWVIGYSDITGIHNQLNVLGVESIHALMGASFGTEMKDIKLAIATFKKALFGEKLEYRTKPSSYNRAGMASGQLVGGNLTLLHTMLGSEASIDTEGKILFIEEIGEYAYHVDRMLWSLKRAGYFKGCKGLIIGDITKVRKNTTKFGRSIQQIILDISEAYQIPVLFNFPAGHEDDNRAMILGRHIDMVVKKQGGSVIFKS